VKAVQKFKRLIDTGHGQMESILGQDIEPHFVQPPLSMSQTDGQVRGHSTHSETPGQDGHSERKPDVKENIFDPSVSMVPEDSKSQIRDIVGTQRAVQQKAADTNSEPSRGASQYSITSSPKSPSPPPQSARADTPSKQSFSEGTRGHARSPLQEEHLYLFIGPSTFTGAPAGDTLDSAAMSPYSGVDSGPNVPTDVNDPLADGVPAIHLNSIPIVSESPSATDINIYEMAYREEIERIRRLSRAHQSPTPKIFLTRRVEGKTPNFSVLLQQVKGAEGPLNKSSSTEIHNAGGDGETAATEAGEEKHAPSNTTMMPASVAPATQDSVQDADTNQMPTASPLRPKPSPVPSWSVTTRISTTAPATTATMATSAAAMTTSVAEKSKNGLLSLLSRVQMDRSPPDKE
jgi:[calcium/calmodulin-dependent protein kinase] kinase